MLEEPFGILDKSDNSPGMWKKDIKVNLGEVS
jgi:hypothetical protein